MLVVIFLVTAIVFAGRRCLVVVDNDAKNVCFRKGQGVQRTRDADLLVHVVDISHPQFEEQVEVVNKTLQEVCESKDKPMIMVFNKIDAFSYTPKDEDDLTPRTRANISLDELRESWMAKMHDNCVFISAKEQINIDTLKDLVYAKAKEIHLTRFPYNDFLFQKYDDIDEGNE